MSNRELAEIKVGDKVEFKRDIEGFGTVLEIQEETSFYGTSTRTFIVGHPGKSFEPFHIMAYSHSKFGSVVALESYDIYSVNGQWV